MSGTIIHAPGKVVSAQLPSDSIATLTLLGTGVNGASCDIAFGNGHNVGVRDTNRRLELYANNGYLPEIVWNPVKEEISNCYKSFLVNKATLGSLTVDSEEDYYTIGNGATVNLECMESIQCNPGLKISGGALNITTPQQALMQGTQILNNGILRFNCPSVAFGNNIKVESGGILHLNIQMSSVPVVHGIKDGGIFRFQSPTVELTATSIVEEGGTLEVIASESVSVSNVKLSEGHTLFLESNSVLLNPGVEIQQGGILITKTSEL